MGQEETNLLLKETRKLGWAMPQIYSEKEQLLLKHFGVYELAIQMGDPLEAYRLAITAAFLSEQCDGPAAESLRRVYLAQLDGQTNKVYRLTDKFDQMIDIRTAEQAAEDERGRI
jgi:hypothetical protein